MGVPLSTRGPFTCGGNCIRIDSPDARGASYTSRSMALLNSIPVLATPAGSGFELWRTFCLGSSYRSL